LMDEWIVELMVWGAVPNAHHAHLKPLTEKADALDWSMTTTVKVSQNGAMILPERLRKSRGIKAGTALRVTEAGESILLTLVHPPTEAELNAVMESAGGPGRAETAKSRQQVAAAIESVRARGRKAKSSH
jgi:AbrB family looped-hinge helix DNA binding protein